MSSWVSTLSSIIYWTIFTLVIYWLARIMGNCFSDPSSPSKGSNKTSGQGQRLGSSATSSAPPPPQQPAANTAGGHQPQAVPSSTDTAGHSTTQPSQSPGRVLGDGFEDPHRGNDARSMAAAAAEERMKTVSLGPCCPSHSTLLGANFAHV